MIGLDPYVETTITLKTCEWAAVVSLLHLALEAGRPASNARSAYDRMIDQMRTAATTVQPSDKIGNADTAITS